MGVTIDIIGNKILAKTGVQKVCFCSRKRSEKYGKNELFALLFFLS